MSDKRHADSLRVPGGSARGAAPRFFPWTAWRRALALLEPILAVVFPSRCPACFHGLSHPSRGPLCASCWERLPRHESALCGCGQPLPPSVPACARCRRGLSPFAAGASLGPYEGSLRILVHELKYRGRRRVALRLGERLVAQPDAQRLLAGAEVVIGVPLHPRRERERGFNQAALLAREIARRIGLPVAQGAVVRRLDTVSQAGLTARARRRNVASAFAVRKRGRISGRRVVLVDDVVTTGATASACAQALLAAGAAEVRLLSVARVV